VQRLPGYWQSGTEQARHDVFPRVLWLVQDQRRANHLAAVIARQPVNARSLVKGRPLDTFTEFVHSQDPIELPELLDDEEESD
jgi:hypothetical protein